MTDLEKWAEEVLEYSTAVAERYDMAFYAFQSPARVRPRLLVLGLNPGRDFNYSAQRDNKLWEFSGGRMTVRRFLAGNPCYGESDNWLIIKNLQKTLQAASPLAEQAQDMVFMNMLYFNSKDFSRFRKAVPGGWKEIYNRCVEFTRRAVLEIIRPEVIVCLGIGNCFRSFKGTGPEEMMIHGRLSKTVLDGIPVYGIPHPSARVSHAARVAIGEAISADLLNGGGGRP